MCRRLVTNRQAVRWMVACYLAVTSEKGERAVCFLSVTRRRAALLTTTLDATGHTCMYGIVDGGGANFTDGLPKAKCGTGSPPIVP